ncbi:MAG: hypothetical protein ABFD66_02150 [Smithella sp.]
MTKPNRKIKIIFCLLAGIFSLLFISVSSARAHSVMLTVPDYPEEATNWCGAASAQMIMEGYPAGSCSLLQEDIWLSIQSYKTEDMWDADPEGMRAAMKNLCPPSGTWSIHSDTDPQALMFTMARLMTRYRYPTAVLLDTEAHNDYAPHQEHWIAVRGIITDLDPTAPGVTSVNLSFVWFNDPAVPMGSPAVERFISGSTWYSEFQTVNKAGSVYAGKYVIVTEPPEIKGLAKAPREVLRGTVITPKDALSFAAKWIEKYKLDEIKTYSLLKKAKPLEPMLVNARQGGYYIIPYTTEQGGRLASLSILVNAYNGNFQEIGVFKPTAYLKKEDAVRLAVESLKEEKPQKVEAVLVSSRTQMGGSRYFPLWEVSADKTILNVGQQGVFFKKAVIR